MSALLERWTGLVWRTPSALWLFALVPLVLLLERRRARRALRFAPATLLEEGGALPATARTRLAGLPTALFALGLVLAVLALARPARREAVPLEREGADLLLALDVSSSMNATDLDRDRTRLAVAKAAASEFVLRRPADRIGLLAFARFTDVVAPPTLDHAALVRALDGLTTVRPDGPEDATALGAATARGAELLARGGARGKVLVLWTDGEETVATAGAPQEIAPAEAALLAARRGVRVHVVVTGATAPDGKALDPTAAAGIASATGGILAKVGDARAAAEVFDRIDALEKTRFLEPRHELADAFLSLLLAAIGCLVAGRLLGATALGAHP